jgi:spermidine synthase
VGVIGLGAGTLAVYGRPGDLYRMYEINPLVIRLAREEFTFLRDCRAKVEVVLGDARLSLEREKPQEFDVLAVDAFSGDAIPVHLITREALGTYLRHVKPDGIVAFHVSNRYFKLPPVVARIAQDHGVHAVLISDDASEDDGDNTTSDWVLVSRDPAALATKEIIAHGPVTPKLRPRQRAWTDNYSNLVQVLR